jgi:hypothetical protein
MLDQIHSTDFVQINNYGFGMLTLVSLGLGIYHCVASHLSFPRLSREEIPLVEFVKEHVPPCVVLVINDNPYGLMFALSYICRTCP